LLVKISTIKIIWAVDIYSDRWLIIQIEFATTNTIALLFKFIKKYCLDKNNNKTATISSDLLSIDLSLAS